MSLVLFGLLDGRCKAGWSIGTLMKDLETGVERVDERGGGGFDQEKILIQTGDVTCGGGRRDL